MNGWIVKREREIVRWGAANSLRRVLIASLGPCVARAFLTGWTCARATREGCNTRGRKQERARLGFIYPRVSSSADVYSSRATSTNQSSPSDTLSLSLVYLSLFFLLILVMCTVHYKLQWQEHQPCLPSHKLQTTGYYKFLTFLFNNPYQFHLIFMSFYVLAKLFFFLLAS